jgi:hypothetical protein
MRRDLLGGNGAADEFFQRRITGGLLGERLSVGFLANMPGGDPAEHGGRYTWAGFRHAGNSKVDAVSEDCA